MSATDEYNKNDKIKSKDSKAKSKSSPSQIKDKGRDHYKHNNKNNNRARRNNSNSSGEEKADGELDLGIEKRSFQVGPRGVPGGIWFFDLNERVLAKLPISGGHFLPATVTSIQGLGFYGVRFDNDRANEFINVPTKYIQYVPEYMQYENEQRIHVLFMKTKSWKPATIMSKLNEARYIVAFDGLDKTFETYIEFIKPMFEDGEKVFSYWHASDKFVPATIVKSGYSTYTVMFKKLDKEFTSTRPDNILRIQHYEPGDEVMALWLKDKKLHPAVVEDIIDPWTVSIRFNGTLTKCFTMPIYQIRKVAE